MNYVKDVEEGLKKKDIHYRFLAEFLFASVIHPFLSHSSLAFPLALEVCSPLVPVLPLIAAMV